MHFNYPIFLDLTGRLAVIIGGGSVAARKARGLIDAGCGEIRAVAPEFPGDLPASIKRIPEPYQSHHLDGAFIAFAATNSPAVNQQVVRHAQSKGILVCRTDNDELMSGDFTNAALHRNTKLTIAVSAAGSPAFAAAVRDNIAKQLPPVFSTMAEQMQLLRPHILNRVLDIAQRRVIFTDLASPEALNVLATNGPEGLKSWLVTKYPMLK